MTAALALGIAGGAGSAQAATLPTLTLTVGASSISVAGATQAGAVNVVATASGAGKEPAVILFALRPEATAAELFKAIETGKDPNVATKFGSIVFDNEALPGKGSEAQTLLTAGKYVALVTEGEGKPKAHTEFTVTTSTSPVALPTPEATEKTIEFGFRGPSTLHDGELVQWENEGFLVHMDFALPVKSKAAAKRLVKDLLTGNERAAGKLIAGQPFGAGPLSTGGFQQTTVTAKPGWYVQACFMDTQDGRQHTQLGMERIIKITK